MALGAIRLVLDFFFKYCYHVATISCCYTRIRGFRVFFCQILTNPLFFISLDEKGTIMLINIQTDISQNRQEPTNYQG